jgi:hypothetical protein
MKRVLINAQPRSGSKTLQSAIQAWLKTKYSNTVSLENKHIDFGLDEFFINRQSGNQYRIYDLESKTWLLKQIEAGGETPDGAFWERLALSADGHIKWEYVPARAPFKKGATDFLAQQLNLLHQLGDRPYVAKMFTGFGIYSQRLFQITRAVYNCFDTHIILRRRDQFANFMSRATCRRVGNWGGVNQTVDTISHRSIDFNEFDKWKTSIAEFEERVASVPNPINLYLEDFSSKLILPNGVIIDMPTRETIEYGDRKYQWVDNLAEVKSWFEQLNQDIPPPCVGRAFA